MRPARPALVALWPSSDAVHFLVDGAAVGRSGSDIDVGDPSVSRRHAHFAHAPSGWTLADLGSRNGTWADGERVLGINHGCEPWWIMNVQSIAVSKFKATCLAVLQRVKRTGKPVLVTRFGKPIAEVVPPSGHARAQRWVGSFQSRGRVVGDIVSPASEHDWEVLSP